MSDLVAHLHVKFCTIKALLKHYVLIASRQCFNSVSVKCLGPFFFPYGCPQTVKKSPKKFSVRGQILHFNSEKSAVINLKFQHGMWLYFKVGFLLRLQIYMSNYLIGLQIYNYK